MNQLTIRLLGGFAVEKNGHALTFSTVKVQALLAYLAIEANRSHPRETLVNMLWGDFEPQSARANLRNTLQRLRQDLGRTVSADLLESTRKIVQLHHSHQGKHSTARTKFKLDVIEFQRCLHAIQSHHHEELSACPTCVEDLSTAVGLYQGEFLAGFDLPDAEPFEHWMRTQRAAFHRNYVEALSLLADIHLANRDVQATQQICEQWLAAEPWSEQAHQQLIRAYLATGQHAAALDQFRECARRLSAEFGADPTPETLQLVESLLTQITQTRSAPYLSQHRTPHPPSEEPEQPMDVRPSPLQSTNPLPQHRAEPTPSPGNYQHRAPTPPTAIQHLSTLPQQRLFGIDKVMQRLQSLLADSDASSLVAIDGIGGIGKTSVAAKLVEYFAERAEYVDILWISAKQQEFLPEQGLQTIAQPALDEEELLNAILEQVGETLYLSVPLAEKRLTANQRLRDAPHLVVVDNLETVTDYEALLPIIRQLAGPTRFLLTSRRSLRAHGDVFNLSLNELGYADAVALIRHEAQQRGIDALADAPEQQLASIYEVVGGNPLALKLVIGQLCFLPLTQVLDNMQLARGREIDELYTYIYWQGWQMLDAPGRQLLLTLPLNPNSTYDELAMMSQLSDAQMQQGLAQLTELSLVEVGGELETREYRLHRLTESFLLHEVMKWQSLTDTFVPEKAALHLNDRSAL